MGKHANLAAPAKVDWTPAKIANLTRLVGENKSSAQIAAIFGCTRSAVSGKANKLGLRFESNFWRPDKVEQLKALIAEGRYADEIAAAMGIARRAVYDKSYHLGIKIAVKTPGPAPTRQARAFQQSDDGDASSGATPPRGLTTTGRTQASLNIRMWDPAFKANCCAWATGDDAEGYFFCAAPKLPGFPYCKPHAQAAYRPPPPRPPSAVKDSAKRNRPERDDERAPLNFDRAA